MNWVNNDKASEIDTRCSTFTKLRHATFSIKLNNKTINIDFGFFFAGVSESSPLHKYTVDTGDDDVFMASECLSPTFPFNPPLWWCWILIERPFDIWYLQALELPVERDSSSSASSRASVTCSQQYPPHSHLHRMYFSSKSTNGARDGNGEGGCSSSNYADKQLETRDKPYSEKDINREETYSSYVQFQMGTHDYHYPIVSDPLSKCSRSTSIMSNCTSVTSQPKMPLTLDPLNLPAPPLLPTKTTGTNVKKQRWGFIGIDSSDLEFANWYLYIRKA